MEGTVDHHVSLHWPRLEEVTIGWRGAYLRGHLTPDDDEGIPLARIGYLGDPNHWTFAIYQASSEDYQDDDLLYGQPTGTPNDALDSACTQGLGEADSRTFTRLQQVDQQSPT